MEQQTYTIREMSERFGLPASTLRYYEEIGLLTDVKMCIRDSRNFKCCIRKSESKRKLHRNFFRLVSSVAHKHTLAVRHLLRLLCKIFIRDNLFPERWN